MSIRRKVHSVNLLYARLEKEIAAFQSESQLSCVSGCGKCCTKPDVEASPLEFLPWAFHQFVEGKALEVLQRLQKEPNSICILFSPLSVVDEGKGRCSEYPYRGLICRLFGYGANRDKLGQLRLATCKIIKENQEENYLKTVQALKNGLEIPIFSDYYQKLGHIDFRLGHTMVPINRALQMALEEVLHYYAYRPFPRNLKKAS